MFNRVASLKIENSNNYISLIKQAHQQRFNESPDILVRAPGRINLIGEHTDYNLGFVLPAAIDKAIYFAVSRAKAGEPNTVFAHDLQEEYTFSTENITPLPDGAWQNYVLGVIAEVTHLKGQLPNLQITFGGNIPQGAGLSSSAALECGICHIFNELFELNFSHKEMAAIAQKAEHTYVGTQCGIMDQTASLMSKSEHVMLLDCRSLEVEYVPYQPVGYQLIICNSNVTHQLASTAYNERRQQCEEGVAILSKIDSSIKSLRDVSFNFLEKNKHLLNEVVYKRCAYITQENDRVLKFCNALKVQEVQELGRLLYEAHDAMRYQYEITCDEIDFMVDFTKSLTEVKGSRMMGGGFGGCTLNIVENEYAEQFKINIAKAYKDKYKDKAGLELSIYDLKIESGVQTISTKNI